MCLRKQIQKHMSLSCSKSCYIAEEWEIFYFILQGVSNSYENIRGQGLLCYKLGEEERIEEVCSCRIETRAFYSNANENAKKSFPKGFIPV